MWHHPLGFSATSPCAAPAVLRTVMGTTERKKGPSSWNQRCGRRRMFRPSTFPLSHEQDRRIADEVQRRAAKVSAASKGGLSALQWTAGLAADAGVPEAFFNIPGI